MANLSGPLKVGQVVLSGINLYRLNFGTYTGLGAKAVAWSLVPVYGWAKAAMIGGQIARLGVQTLVRQPESVPQVMERLQPKMWGFLGVGILVGLIQLAVNLTLSVLVTVVMVPINLFGALLGDVGTLIAVSIGGIVRIALFLMQLWVQSRFLVFNVAIAVETEKEATDAIGRSWSLSERSVFGVMGTLLLTGVMLMPIFLLTMIPFYFTLSPVADILTVPPEEISDAAILTLLMAFAQGFLGFIVLVFVVQIFTNPLFQSVKAVLYAQLCDRQEDRT